MPRTARITFPHGFYHLYNRGLNKGLIFRDKSDYEKIMKTFSELTRFDDWTIYAYCFMPNHYHFLVEEKRVPIAKFVGRLFTSYSQYFNRKYQRTGPVFQDRFKSKLIQKDSYFLEVSRYIHCNPVKAGLIRMPEEYPYSSMGEYADNRSLKIINRNKVVRLIENTSWGMRQYIRFVRAGVKIDLDKYDPFSSQQEVIGSHVFTTNRKRGRK